MRGSILIDFVRNDFWRLLKIVQISYERFLSVGNVTIRKLNPEEGSSVLQAWWINEG